jgi:membrane protease YdiL (CAAX protease family)
MKTFLHSSVGRIIRFVFIFLFVAAAVFLLLRRMNWQSLKSANLQYNLVLAILMVFLPLAALLVVWALRFWGYRGKPWTVLVTAYGLPLLAVIIIHLRLMAVDSPLLVDGLYRSTWQPLYYLWQTFVLLFSGWFLFSRSGAVKVASFKEMMAGLVTGLGIGVGAAFFCSILIHQFRLSGRVITTPDPPGLLLWAVLAVGLTLSPYAVQYFYRTILEPYWAKTYSEPVVVLMTAAVFALVQARLLLLPVGFAAGLGFSLLFRRTALWPAVAAHAVFNLVLFGLGWFLVI